MGCGAGQPNTLSQRPAPRAVGLTSPARERSRVVTLRMASSPGTSALSLEKNVWSGSQAWVPDLPLLSTSCVPSTSQRGPRVAPKPSVGKCCKKALPGTGHVGTDQASDHSPVSQCLLAGGSACRLQVPSRPPLEPSSPWPRHALPLQHPAARGSGTQESHWPSPALGHSPLPSGPLGRPPTSRATCGPEEGPKRSSCSPKREPRGTGCPTLIVLILRVRPHHRRAEAASCLHCHGDAGLRFVCLGVHVPVCECDMCVLG